MIQFKVGDKVRGIGADIKGCEGIIEKVRAEGYSIRLTKIGKNEWQGQREWQMGNLLERDTFWEDSLELISSGHSMQGKFKVGDNVKILWKKTGYSYKEYDDIGEIVEVFPTNCRGDYEVKGFCKHDHSYKLGFKEGELEAMQPFKTAEELIGEKQINKGSGNFYRKSYPQSIPITTPRHTKMQKLTSKLRRFFDENQKAQFKAIDFARIFSGI